VGEGEVDIFNGWGLGEVQRSYLLNVGVIDFDISL
jgi:hypothetical protein